EAGDRLVHDPAARRHHADEVQARPRAAHGRAPDLRPRRPLDDHPSPPAPRHRRQDRRPGHVPGAGPVPARDRRLPRHLPPQPPARPGGGTRTIPGAPVRTCNYQLFERVTAAGDYKPKPLPPPSEVQTDGGCTFKLNGASNLTAIQAQLVHVDVTCNGKPATFQPYYGALAHAIFFRQGSLDYFHT